MRTLNRPMFRMGGPIKEGVMHGIREPKNMGGRMLLVGQHPKELRDKSGREHHLAPVVYGVGAGLLHGARMALPWAARMGSRYIMPMFRKQIGTQTVQKAGPSQVIKGGTKYSKGYPGGRVAEKIIGPGTAEIPKYGPTWLGRDPVVKTVGAAGKAIFNPTVGGAAAKAARFATSPSVLAGTAAYMFWPDGTPKTQEELLNMNNIQPGGPGGPPGGGDPNMGYVDPEKAKQLAAKKRDERVTNLLETMGYDTAKKDAIGKALIDASQIVTERGTLDKKNITQELINPIIAATSKRLEKPEQLNEAVRLMLTKAEIEKEMNPLKDEALRVQIAAGKKTLAGGTLQEAVLEQTLKQGAPTGATLSQIARAKGVDNKVLPIKIPKNQDTLEVATEVITDTWKNAATEPDKVVKPGFYVVKDRIILVGQDGSIKPYL